MSPHDDSTISDIPQPHLFIDPIKSFHRWAPLPVSSITFPSTINVQLLFSTQVRKMHCHCSKGWQLIHLSFVSVKRDFIKRQLIHIWTNKPGTNATPMRKNLFISTSQHWSTIVLLLPQDLKKKKGCKPGKHSHEKKPLNFYHRIWNYA